MKMILAVLLTGLSLLLTGCYIPYSQVDAFFEDRAEGHSLYEDPLFTSLRTFDAIREVIDSRIIWTEDVEHIWQEPEYTWTERTGDCEDMAILYLNILYLATGEKGKLVLVNYAKTIVNGGFRARHAIIWSHNMYRDPVSGTEYSREDVMYEYNFDTVFSASF
ncbi:MAG: hypothetical protein PQJ60_12060 [Spirochaetales bacterium]|nr:hypothetical protein [Spirochaetales bacterium]